MSYLNSLRVHFAGGFEAAPSTVNNDVTHFDNAGFKPEYQLPDPGATNGWWNPEGDHRFKFDCRFTTASYGDGTAVPAADQIVSLRVFDRGDFSAKIVDLDPQQQMVSMVFGLEVAIGDAAGTVLLRGAFAAAPFTDIWTRGTTGGGDERAAATYQSVLESLQWGDLSGSRFLQELKAAASDGILSIKFNLDGYSMARGTPGFTKGRIVGTIGPARANEPRHFVRGRHFSNLELLPSPGFPQPRFGVNFCVGALDEGAGKIRLDLGNALTTNPSRGPAHNIGTLALTCSVPGAAPLALGAIDYLAANWYEQTAGIVDLPQGRRLSDAELSAVREHPLALVVTPPGQSTVVAASEASDGIHARADLFVARLNPGDTFATSFFASRFGQPMAGATISLNHQTFSPDPGQPPIGIPQSALTLPAVTTSDADGRAKLPLQAASPGNPRQYIDGQVYFVNYALNGNTPLNPSDFLSVLVWDAFNPDEPPTWFGSMLPIFQQFANLYPVMKGYVDLASYEDVSANRESLLAVLNLPQMNSHYMPVTRDLSEAKRLAIVRWLTNVGADGKPLLGAALPGVGSGAAALAGAGAPNAPDGSKDRAMRTLSLRRSTAERT